MPTSVKQAAESWRSQDPVTDASPSDAATEASSLALPDQRPLEPSVRNSLGSHELTATRARVGPPASAAAAQGPSGPSTVVMSATAAAGCAAVNLWLTHGRLTFFFDLCFVVLCLVAAVAVRSSDLFTVGVLPPLLFAAVIAMVALVTPAAFEPATGVDRVFLTGLATHAFGLVAGYAVALLTVAARTAAARS